MNPPRYCLDANVLLNAQEYYPLRIFRPLWIELAKNVGHFLILKNIFQEIKNLTPDSDSSSHSGGRADWAIKWIEDNGLHINMVDPDYDGEISNQVKYLSRKYEIEYKSKGVGENDITLIVYAKKMHKTVVTYETMQNPRPHKKSKYKIPAVCEDEDVKCITFIEMLDALRIKL